MTAKEICGNCDPRIKAQAENLAEQILSIGEKLSEARASMKDEDLVVEYDNGGGQHGFRENPYFTAYEHLLATYTRSLSVLAELIGDDANDAEESPLNKLRAQFKVV